MLARLSVPPPPKVGESLEMHILRQRVEVRERITLGVPHSVVPMHLAGAPPQYCVVSGLVLTALSVPYMEGAFGRRWSRNTPVRCLQASVHARSSMAN